MAGPDPHKGGMVGPGSHEGAVVGPDPHAGGMVGPGPHEGGVAGPDPQEVGVAGFTESQPGPSGLNPPHLPGNTFFHVELENISLQAELLKLKHEIRGLKAEKKEFNYQREHYSVKNMDDNVVCMETGLPNKDIFNIVFGYVQRFADCINYFAGWKVTSISLEDQIFITLMKIRHNYNNLHLAKLFHSSTATIRNIIVTFIHVLYHLLYENCMNVVPSREKNQTSLPGSFIYFGNCKMIIDCTDIQIAIPSKMSHQKVTYSTYRGYNSFKVLLGVAPNAVINYVSPLYPGSVSDKAIVEKSGIMSNFIAGDLILADKGFLIQDIVPDGVTVNIPPFLNKAKFTENEIKMCEKIARCRIHVERANARLKDFKILNFIPAYLRCYAEILVKLCAALVNLQYPLINEIKDTIKFD